MKLLIDLLPVLAFFGVFRFARAFPDLALALVVPVFGAVQAGSPELTRELPAVMLATLATIVATVVQIAWLRWARHPIRPAVWIGAVIVTGFGLLTIWLQNEWFIKWKPTILDWTFASVLAGWQLAAGRNLLGAMLGADLRLPAPVWDRLLWAWVAFFTLMGAANLVVAYQWSTDAWVNFKLVGGVGLPLVFSVATGFYVMRFIEEEPADGR